MGHEQGGDPKRGDPVAGAHIDGRMKKVRQRNRCDQVQSTENIEDPQEDLGRLEIPNGQRDGYNARRAAMKSPIAAGHANWGGMPG
jgi:hypothetical protein